jgi:ATP-dependent DNA ligase
VAVYNRAFISRFEWLRSRPTEELAILPVYMVFDPHDGLKAWEEAVARGFEGVVAKNPESRYVPGRTTAWLKVKQPHYREGERGREQKGKS